MRFVSLGGKYAGILTETLKNGQISFYINYKENGVSKRKKVGTSPEMTKSKALLLLQEKKSEIRLISSVSEQGIEPTTKNSQYKKNISLNQLADIYFSSKKYTTLKEVKIKYDYHVRDEPFANKLIQLITTIDINYFIDKKMNQRADKRRVIDKLPIEEKEALEYEENLLKINNVEAFLIANPEDWRERNRLEYLKKRNEILHMRLNDEARLKIMNHKSIGIDEKRMMLGLLSRKTIKEILFFCSTLLNFARKELKLNYENVFVNDIKVENERDRYMSKDEIKAFLAETKLISETQIKHKNVYLISLLALSTAARQNTILSIKIGDIDLENWIIKLKNYKKQRDFSYRISSEEEYNEIIKLIGTRDKSEFLFKNYTDENPYRYPRIMKDILIYTVNYKKSYTDWLTLKEFRNTTASHLAMNGVPLAHIAQVLDHKDLKATRRYARLQQTVAEKAIGDYMGDILKN